MEKRNYKPVLISIFIALFIILIILSASNVIKEISLKKESKDYNLYNQKIIDMKGKLIKNWTNIGMIFDISSDYRIIGREKQFLRIIDWDDKIILNSSYEIHHDGIFLEDGSYLILSNDIIEYKNRNLSFNSILLISQEGELIYNWSTYNNLEKLKKYHKESPLEKIKSENSTEKITETSAETTKNLEDGGRLFRGYEEYYHLNAIQELPDSEFGKTDKRFQKGNWLVSDRTYDLVFIIDKDSKEIVWVLNHSHGIIKQHMPRMMKNGNIIIFDNGGISSTTGENRSYSRVVEYNPKKDKIIWEYIAEPPESFFSSTRGSAQLLENGNILITESNKGRSFEITEDEKIVWEWINPYNTSLEGDNGFYRMQRITKEFFDKAEKI